MNKHTAFYCLLFLLSCSKSVLAEQKQHRIPDVVVNNPSHHTSMSGSINHTLTRQQMALTGATSLTDALHATAGLQLHDASGTGAQASIGMRGFGANASTNSLVLINGIPLTNPDLMAPDINALPLEDISRIEITSGSESVLYGDQAVGGIVNIITDEAAERNLRLQCGAGSFNLRECHARFANMVQGLNYRLNFTSKSTNNYRDHNDYLNNTFLGTATYHQHENDFAFDYKFTHENMQYPGALTAPQVWENRRQSSNSTDYFKDHNQYLHIRIKTPVYHNWKFSTDGFVRTMSGTGVLSSTFNQSRGSLFFRPQLFSQNDSRNWRTGIDFRIDRYHLESSYGLTNNHQLQGGLFGLMNVKLNKQWAIILGARGAQQNTQLNTNISASTINRASATTLGLTYQPSPDITIFVRRAGSYRFPKAEENTAGHEPLRTQRGISYEAGITYDLSDTRVDAAIFQLNLRDEIAFDPLQTPQNPFGTNTNLAPTARTGASLSGKHHFTKLLTADAQIDYVDARFRTGVDSGNQIPLVSDLTARGGILYRIDKHFHAYAETVFTGKQFPANDNANITGGVGGYTTYNFNLRYHYQTFSAALHINNIFNKNYYLYTVYQAPTEYFYPAPDRNFMLTVNYAFE